MQEQPKPELPSLLPPRLQAAVEAALIGTGWKYSVDWHKGGCYTHVPAPFGLIGRELVFQVDADRPRVVITLGLGVTPTEATRGETALLLGWLNTIVSRVTLSVGRSNDLIKLQAALEEGIGHRVDADTIDLLINELLYAEDLFAIPIRDVAEGESSAVEGMKRIADRTGLDPFPGRKSA